MTLTPVASPGFLDAPASDAADRLKSKVQCVIRDTARHSRPRYYFLVEGARQMTVSDQLMKRELIVQGMGWGHLPGYLIEDDLAPAGCGADRSRPPAAAPAGPPAAATSPTVRWPNGSGLHRRERAAAFRS